jgi:hypothetical protein
MTGISVLDTHAGQVAPFWRDPHSSPQNDVNATPARSDIRLLLTTNNRANQDVRVKSMVQLSSQVTPPFVENDCSQRTASAARFSHVMRSRIDRPL